MTSSNAYPSVAQELAPLFSDIAALIQQSRQQVQLAVNSAMVHCYWPSAGSLSNMNSRGKPVLLTANANWKYCRNN